MLEKIKMRLGLNGTFDKDGLLLSLIDTCESEVRNYCHIENVSCLFEVIVDMVCFKFRRLGSEGISAEGYSGVSFSYTSDYPESILSQLRAHRKVRTC